MNDAHERAAEAIYNLMPFDGDPIHKTKPEWLPGGNSLKQDEARRYAAAALAAKPADDAVNFIRVVGEELVNAGMPAGDRSVILGNIRSLIAATPAVGGEAWFLTREDMEKLHGQAHSGAMLGGDNAYQACLTIEGILGRIAQRAIQPASKEVSTEELTKTLQAALAFIDTALVADENPTMSKRAIVRIINEVLAAPPASPLRGREWPKEEIEPGRFVDVDPEVLELTNCFNALLLIERGLDEPLATRIAAQWQQKCTELAILRSASPPEQPAAEDQDSSALMPKETM